MCPTYPLPGAVRRAQSTRAAPGARGRAEPPRACGQRRARRLPRLRRHAAPRCSGKRHARAARLSRRLRSAERPPPSQDESSHRCPESPGCGHKAACSICERTTCALPTRRRSCCPTRPDRPKGSSPGSKRLSGLCSAARTSTCSASASWLHLNFRLQICARALVGMQSKS